MVASKDAGVRVLDADTNVTLSRVIVSEPLADAGCGYGVEVDGGTLDMRLGGVIGANSAGIYANLASVTLDEIFVFDTSTDSAGRYGRAVHTQDSFTEVTRSYLSGSTDTSIMILRPIGGRIDQILIDITQEGIIAGRTTGDSITVVGGDGALYAVTNNISIDAARAAILLEDANVVLAGNTELNSGALVLYGSESLGQKRLKLGGADAASVLWLAPGSEVEIDRDDLACTP